MIIRLSFFISGCILGCKQYKHLIINIICGAGGTQLLCIGGKPGDSVEFEFNQLEDCPYQLVVYATKAPDYGIVSFSVNGQDTHIKWDGYDTKVTLSDPISLGCYSPVRGALTLKISLSGANPKAVEEKNLFGLDAIQLMKKQ